MMCGNSCHSGGTGHFLTGMAAGIAAGAALGAVMAPSSRQIKRAAHRAARRVWICNRSRTCPGPRFPDGGREMGLAQGRAGVV